MAFDGDLEPRRTSILYRISVLLVFCAMVLLPVIYLGMIVAAAAGVYWYAIHGLAIFSILPVVRVGRLIIFVGVMYIAPLFAGGLLVIFMILPLFWRARKTERPLWVDRNEQPLLYAYIEKLCDVMRAPRPVRIDVIANANASAHIDNGLLGLVSRRLVLTVGLPLAQTMDLRQFTGVLAHELGHFTQGGSMRLSYAVAMINLWFVRLAYFRSGVDDLIDSFIGNEPHWTMSLIGLLSKLVLGIARLFLKMMAMLSVCLCRHLSRLAEFDADHQSARIVGCEAAGDALQVLPFISTASSIAIANANDGWKRRQLPDDLVSLAEHYRLQLPDTVKDKITAGILGADARWFDTHPPLFKRVAALKKSGTTGVLNLNAPAQCLFRDFDELKKLATISMYQCVLGDALQPQYLVPTAFPQIKKPAAAKAAAPGVGKGTRA